MANETPQIELSSSSQFYDPTAHKYRLFRNYMANELGVGRAEIEEWTRQAVQEAVERSITKVLQRHNIEALIERAAMKMISDTSYSTGGPLKDIVAKKLVEQITLTIKT